jgi:hypothetical protein
MLHTTSKKTVDDAMRDHMVGKVDTKGIVAFLSNVMYSIVVELS